MSSSISNLLGELLKDNDTKEKLAALSENIEGTIDKSAEDTPENNSKSLKVNYSNIDKKIEILSVLCPILGEEFTSKAQKVIKALKAIKVIFDLEKSN